MMRIIVPRRKKHRCVPMERRIVRQIFINTRYGEIILIVQPHDLIQRIGIAKKRAGQTPRKQDRTRIFQPMRPALGDPQTQDLRRIRLHKITERQECLVPHPNDMRPAPRGHHHMPEIAAVVLVQHRPQWQRDRFLRTRVSVKGLALHHLRHPFVIRIIMIERQLVPDPQTDQ
jgi:hypothetical protein